MERCIICKTKKPIENFRICESCVDKEFKKLRYIIDLLKDKPIWLWDEAVKFYRTKLYYVSLFFTKETEDKLKAFRKERALNKRKGIISEIDIKIKEWVVEEGKNIRLENKEAKHG